MAQPIGRQLLGRQLTRAQPSQSIGVLRRVFQPKLAQPCKLFSSSHPSLHNTDKAKTTKVSDPSQPTSSSKQQQQQRNRRKVPATLLAAGGGALALALAFVEPVTSNGESPSSTSTTSTTPGQNQPQTTSGGDDNGLPYYRLSEVKEHGPKSQRPWVTYQGKIYDITDWIPAHPGGEVILRAAGGSIEPYWNIFAIHKTQYVRDILETYAIGQVHPDDLLQSAGAEVEDPFVTDPERDPRLRLLTTKPCNAESPGEELGESFLTPNGIFYVRNHMWVPVIDKADTPTYEITIELPNGDVKSYTLRDLQTRFKQHAVTAVMQCSGNRRKDMTTHARKTNGLQWTVGAISCAKWEGVLLRDVLADAGLSFEPSDDAQHVQFSGAEAYGASIPIASAIDPRGDVLLAMRMNDELLPRDHGYPIRVVVPGHVAARCVKWLKKIVISDEESSTSWQRKDYKCFGPNEVKQDWDKYKSIQKMPITSAITKARMKPGEEGAGTVRLEGYAYSGGGNEIQRVDISLNGGETWDQATLVQDDMKLEQGHKSWCWKRWKYEGHLPDHKDCNGNAVSGRDREHKTTFVVKATDDSYNTQPETYTSIYNMRGNLATAWHRLDFTWEEDAGEKKS